MGRNTGSSTDGHIRVEHVGQVLTDCGYRKKEPQSSGFDAAFSRQHLFTSQAFLVKTITEDRFGKIDAKGVVESGRQWCANHLNASFLVNESGLNLVLLHRGQVRREHLRGLTDASGLHGAICQSVTAVQTGGGPVMQETTWIVIGRVRKALGRLKELRP